MSRASEPLVSVVTPVYNEVGHIRECIESVMAQTYSNWQLVVVDNASTDGTGEVLRGIAAREHRLRIVTNTVTVPVLDNFNLAMSQVSPEAKYCKALAGDDLLFPRCLEKMVSVAEDHPEVGVVSSFSLTGSRVDPGEFPFVELVLPGPEVVRAYLTTELPLIGAPTLLLYRADVVRSRAPFFRGSKMHADVEACLEVLQQHGYAFVPEILTFSRVREGSYTSAANRLNVYMPNMLEFLVGFGPGVLSATRFSDRLRDQLARYYAYLGREALRRRDNEFWEYHRERLAGVGHPMSRGRVWLNAILTVFEHVLRRARGSWPDQRLNASIPSRPGDVLPRRGRSS